MLRNAWAMWIDHSRGIIIYNLKHRPTLTPSLETHHSTSITPGSFWMASSSTPLLKTPPNSMDYSILLRHTPLSKSNWTRTTMKSRLRVPLHHRVPAALQWWLASHTASHSWSVMRRASARSCLNTVINIMATGTLFLAMRRSFSR